MTDHTVPTTVPSPDGDGCVVWHRRQLRVADQPAVTLATRDFDVVCPLFVFDPHFYEEGLACDSRIRFLHECLTDLRRAYDRHRTSLVFAHGDPQSVLTRFVDVGWTVLATADPSGRDGLRRDDELAAALDVSSVAVAVLTRALPDVKPSPFVASGLRVEAATRPGGPTVSR